MKKKNADTFTMQRNIADKNKPNKYVKNKTKRKIIKKIKDKHVDNITTQRGKLLKGNVHGVCHARIKEK